MAFHETFWVAAAAAAPLIALANQVTLTDMWGIRGTFKKAEIYGPPGTRHDAAKSGLRAASRAYLVGYINLLVQAGVLIAALRSLYYGRDSQIFPPLPVVYIEGLGLAALVATSLLTGNVRSALARLDAEGGRNRTRSSKNDDAANNDDAAKPEHLKTEGGDGNHA
jgi:hypothetical protein